MKYATSELERLAKEADKAVQQRDLKDLSWLPKLAEEITKAND